MDKHGTDKILSVYWFVILIIVAGGIFAMVYTFYHRPYDIRELEAGIMINQIADCLSEQGKLNSGLITGGKFNEDFKNNFLEKCHLNFNVENDWDKPQYYAEINFYDVGDVGNSIFNISEGDKDLISNCEIQKDKKYERLAKCVERRFYSLDEEDNQYLIKILSVVRKTEKNVK